MRTGLTFIVTQVSGFSFVTDPEGRVKLIQEYVDSVKNEDVRQDLILAVSEDHKNFPGKSDKTTLSNH